MHHMNGVREWRWLFVQGFLCAYDCLVVWANSMSVGIVSNSWPPTRGPPSLLMADVRCLPGQFFLIFFRVLVFIFFEFCSYGISSNGKIRHNIKSWGFNVGLKEWKGVQYLMSKAVL